jgi:hypothetical protein
MAWLTYDNYSLMGYALVSEIEFDRFETMAEATINRYTQNKFKDTELTKYQLYGVAEVTNMLYRQMSVVTETSGGQAIQSFSNQKYSESYATSAEAQAQNDNALKFLLDTYFGFVNVTKYEWA